MSDREMLQAQIKDLTSRLHERDKAMLVIREELAIEKTQRATCITVIEELVKAENGVVALMVAESAPLKKQKGERDTEFVKRIARAYNRIAIHTMAETMIKGCVDAG